MAFLTLPYFWIGIAAATIPVIIHLILRNRAEIVNFAALRFLKPTPKKMLRRQKLKQILLLAMRILALLLLGLAFARPIMEDRKLGTLIGQEPAAIAILVDVSASMAAKDHLQRAVAAAREIVENANQNDRITLITSAASTHVLAENAEPSVAAQALPQIQQEFGAGNLRDAVQFVDHRLQESAFERRYFYLISDFQVSNMSLGNLTLASLASFQPVEIQSPWQNAAILGGERFEREGQLSYACRVRNFADSEQTIEVQIETLNDRNRAAASRSVAIPAQTEQTVRFTAAELGRLQTPVTFRCRAPLDDFAYDDRFFLAPKSADQHRLLLVGGHSDSEFFVKEALNLPGTPFQTVYSTANALQRIAFDDFEAILFIGASGINREAATKLKAYLEAGGGLVIALSDRISVDTFNHVWGELLPGEIIEQVNAAARNREDWTLTGVDFAHPIFKIFEDPANGDPSSVRVSSYYELKLGPQALEVASLENGGTILAEQPVGNGKVLLWTSTFDLSAGSFPVRSIFVPMLHQIVNYVRRPVTPKASVTVGNTIFLADDFEGTAKIEVVRPNGEQDIVEEQDFIFNNTGEPGHYVFRQAGRTIHHAVNLDPRESDPAALALEDVQARFSVSEDTQLSSLFGATTPASLREREKQQKLWRFLLWGLLVLLLAESWLANRTLR